MSLVAAFGLYAEEEPFSSFGSTWLQINGEGGRVDGAYPYGASVELNLGLINLKHFGIDLAIGAEATSLDYNGVDYETYAAYVALKPYINLYKGESFGLTVFGAAFVGYENSEVSWTGWNGYYVANYRYTQHTFSYGLKAGVEISFANDFYIAPAAKYTRYESIDDSTYGFSASGFDSLSTDESALEIELGYRITSWISLHVAYVYIIEKEVLNVDLDGSEVKAGLRITF